jgi:predicted cation transporter
MSLAPLPLGDLEPSSPLEDKGEESVRSLFLRALKVYIFLASLIFLGHGFSGVMSLWMGMLPDWAIYWINMSSAMLDNATLAATEISPHMDFISFRFALMGLLISGGMLIPGNLPNIICAGKLKIRPKEWAVFAVPVGLILMTCVFIFLKLFS